MCLDPLLASLAILHADGFGMLRIGREGFSRNVSSSSTECHSKLKSQRYLPPPSTALYTTRAQSCNHGESSNHWVGGACDVSR